MLNAVESGVKDLRLHFVRETVAGAIQADPAWLRFSDSVKRFSINPNANLHHQRPIGTVDPVKFQPGPEDYDLQVQYHLQRWIGGATKGPEYDGMVRAADNALLNTHGILARQALVTGGALSAGRRVYTVVKGARVSRVGLNGQSDDGEPMIVTVDYRAEKIRSYVIAQPSSGSTVTAESTDASDTTQTVTVENEGAGSSEGIALNGTTPVAGVTSFTDIDSISLSAETKGDVIVKIGATEIFRILGKDSNGGYEGDLGIPPLGSGSFEAALGSAYELVVGSSFQWGGAAIESAATLRTLEMMVENNLEVTPRVDSRRRRITEGNRTLQANVSVYSEIGSHESLVNHLKATEQDLVWTLVNGSITLSNAALTSVGGRVYESGQATMQRNNVFTARGITISS